MPNCTRCDGKGWLRSDEMECAASDTSPCEACRGSGQREDQLSYYIRTNQILHKRLSDAEIKDWLAELVQIENCKPPKPVILDDGRVMIWNGPDLSKL